jgi:hypothetical protein
MWNLNQAYLRVMSNQGVGGVDKMEVDSLKSYLSTHKESLISSLYQGNYCPNPVLRVEIPKDNGSTRLQGVPQGGPLSPLLSNILLNELDKELESRGHKFVRYADDLIILCKSQRSARRTLENILPFIENKLYLKVNRDKTQVTYVRNVKFWGYSFYIMHGKCRLRIHPKSVLKLKSKLKLLTKRSNGWSNERRKESLRQFIKGWIQYFKYADMNHLLRDLDEWLRRRIRMVIWKQWKRFRTKVANLIKLGVKKSKAWEWANTRKGYWHTAGIFILHTTITSERLNKAGYITLQDYYRKVRVEY